nr:hypothetical protein [Tanacetum cinerariifolium]
MCEMFCQIIQKKQEDKRIEEEQAAKARYWKILACCDDDDDYDFAITPILSTEEPIDSLSMGDEHLDTILATESDELIMSCVENLVLNPSESEGENGCDVPSCFTTFSNILFDADYDFKSVDDQCDVPFHDNSPPLDVSEDQFEDLFESKEEFSSTDDESFSFDKIDYVEASPPDSELVSSEVMEIVIPEVGGIEASNDNPILFMI